VNDKIFYTVKEVAEYWNCGDRTVRQYCADKTITAYFIGGKWKIPEYALREYEEKVCNTRP